MTERRFILLVNGDLPDPWAARGVLQPGDVIIAVDGGLRHTRALGVRPDVLIGDLDSLSAEEIQAAEMAGARILRHPPEKDDTDLELALALALAEGAAAILLVGALGGRVDHQLGNLALLLRKDLDQVDLRIDDGIQQVFLIKREAVIFGQPGDIVSLIPIGEPARDVVTAGLRYPLQAETLYPHRTRGISNVMLTNRAEVRLSSGVLYCVHIRAAQNLEEIL